jgi:hypothetical protein
MKIATLVPVLLVLATGLVGCSREGGGSAAPVAPASAAAGPASATPTSPVASPAATPDNALRTAIVGSWRQICLPYIPGDGASDITYTISLQGADKLKLEGVAKDYKNTTCAGGGKVIATPVFSQKIVGTGVLGGVPVLSLMDDDAPNPAPSDSKSVIGIDSKQLRMGNAKGARDADGFPSAFEAPQEAYNRL